MSDKVFLGQHVSKLDIGEKPARITRVNLFVDSEHMYTAGNDTGRTIEKTCPWGSQAMCNRILALVSGIEYQPFSGESALIDPAAETGDGITVGGVYSVLADSTIRFNGLYFADVAAPGGNEIEDEYPYKSRARRAADRQLAETRSRITKTAEEIRLEVENELNGLSSSISVQLDSITSTVQGQGGAISALTQKVDSFTLEVSNGKTSSTIQLKAGNAVISSKKIQMDGLVTFSGLSAGTTTIDGACIKTGTIDADRLNLTGAITFSDLSSGVKADISEAWDMACDAQSLANDIDGTVAGWTYRGTTYIDGEKLMTGTVRASTLEGGEISLLDSRGREVGTFTLAWADSYDGRKMDINAGAIAVVADYGALYLQGGQGRLKKSSLELDDRNVWFGGDAVPNMDEFYILGDSGYRWADIYCANSEIITSDREKKTEIRYGLGGLDSLFDRLRPCSYRFKTGKRTHPGLIAQDLEQAMEESGVSDMEFSAFIRSPREDGGSDYGIRYGELIPLLIDQVQRLKQKLNQWEARYGSKEAAG